MKRLIVALAALVLLRADMFQDASNAKLPNARIELGVGPQVSAEQFGMKGDGVSTTGITTTAGSTTFGGLSLTQADVGKLIWVPGAGTGGAPLITTVASPTTFATPATNAVPATWYGSGNCDVVARGSGYAPGDTITMAGGTGSVPLQCTVHYTTVTAATVAAGGTMASPPPDGTVCQVRGTTWAGPPLATQAASVFHVKGTIVGGALTGPLALSPHGGSYTANNPPTTAEPVTPESAECLGLTGATVNLTIGVLLARRTVNGVYTAAPANPAGQASTSGSGSGATFNLAYTQSGAVMYGSDNYGADARGGLRGVFATPGNQTVHFPAGIYLTSSCAPLAAAAGVSLVGDGRPNTLVMLPPECGLTGNYWTWSAATGGRPIIQGLTLDVNNAVRRVRGLGAGVGLITFNAVTSFIDNVAIRGASGQQYGFFILGNINGTIIQNSRYTARPDIDVMGCITTADGANQTPETPSPMQNMRIINNLCDGAGIQADGDRTLVMGNEITHIASGSGLYPPPNSMGGMFINNVVRDSMVSFDNNWTSAEGIEVHGFDTFVVGNSFYNLAGPGIVNFAKRSLISGNKCENVSLLHSSLGAPGSLPSMDYSVEACIRSITNFATGTITNNTSSATGGMRYGYTEDVVDTPLATPTYVFGNNFVGTVAPTYITNPATNATNTANPNFAFSEAPAVGVNGNLSSPTFGATSVAIPALRGYLSAPGLKSDFTGSLTSVYGYDFGPTNLSSINPANVYGYTAGGVGTGNAATSGAYQNIGFLAGPPTAAAGVGATLLNVGLRSGLGTGSSAGTTNRGIWITGNGGAASTNYAIYSDSTARSYFAGPMTVSGLPTSAGAGGLAVCVDSAGVLYKKAACP